MNGHGASVLERECPPGRLMGMVATQLAAHGFQARDEDSDDDSRRLTVAGLRGMHCRLTIWDCGHIACEYVPQRGWKADPARIAGLVVSLLASDGSEQRQAAGKPGLPGLPLRTVVGAELIAAGLEVELAAYPDLTDFAVIAELVATNPDHPERGEVCIADDGSITMERDCWKGTSAAGAEEVAAAIASSIGNAIARFNAAVYPPAVVARNAD